jgi:hypothetical protein
MNPFCGSPKSRPNPAKWPVGAAAGLLLAGALLLTGIGWFGLERIAPASTPMECWDPVLPLLPLTAVYLLNFQP